MRRLRRRRYEIQNAKRLEGGLIVRPWERANERLRFTCHELGKGFRFGRLLGRADYKSTLQSLRDIL